MEAAKTLERFQSRADKEYDYFVNIGIKIIDNLLLVNSAIVAILISTDKISVFKFPILFLILSSFSAILALYLQKELSRESSITFRMAEIFGENALQEQKTIQQEELPGTAELRRKSGQINFLINFSLLSFSIAFVIILLVIFL